jgi:predicted kinase
VNIDRHGSARKPLLVLVQGAPASGKITLARRLADALTLPLLSRDRVKEIVCDTVRPASLDEAERLGPIPFELSQLLVAELLAARIGVIAEANYHRGRAEADIRPLLPACRAVLVHCRVDPETSKRRSVERFERGERHWSYFDAERLARSRSRARPVDWSRYEPLDLGIPTLSVDTTDAYDPPFDEIVASVSSAHETR